jgi:hypothetical protein
VVAQSTVIPSSRALRRDADEKLRLYRYLDRRELYFLTKQEIFTELALVFGSREWNTMRKIVRDSDFRIQVAVGLVLKRVSSRSTNSGLYQVICNDIQSHYGPDGLRVAKLVAFGGLEALKAEIAALRLKSRQERRVVESFFRRVGQAVFLVESSGVPSPNDIAKETRQYSPNTCLVSAHPSYVSAAAALVDTVIGLLGSQFGRVIRQGPAEYNAFLGKLSGGTLRFQAPVGWG